MATIRQINATRKVVETGGNVTAAMRAAGYPPATYNNPSVLTKSKGYKEVLAEYGLTDELVVAALAEDIKKKKGRRVSELNLGSEILGLKKAGEKPGGNTYNTIVVGGDQAARIARRTIARITGSEEIPDRLLDSDEPQV